MDEGEAKASDEPTFDTGPSYWWVLLIVAVLALALYLILDESGDDSGGDQGGNPSVEAPVFDVPLVPMGREVLLEVEGDDNTLWADVTFSVDGGTEQLSGTDLPLSRTETGSGIRMEAQSGDFLYLTAQRDDDGQGEITCRISVDGEVISEVTSSGSYVIASCSGTAP